LDFIARSGERPPSAREILRGAGIKTRKEVDATLAALLVDGVIEVTERKTNGRPARGYRLTTEGGLSS
jgi:predicted ArsR family transcriptional regulator